MDFLMLRKDSVPPKTGHYTMSLKHLTADDNATSSWLLIQIYTPEQDQTLREWIKNYEATARLNDGETDIRRVLNEMVNMSCADRLRFKIEDGVMFSNFPLVGVFTDIDVAKILVTRDELA